MKHFLLITTLQCFFILCCGQIFSICPKETLKIAEKIWRNECRGTQEGLTCWNEGENFGSFGIGHFIWYHKDHQSVFQQTFPDLLVFLQIKGIVLPPWLTNCQGCPWTSRENFKLNFSSPEMCSLRQLLFDTRDLQAEFIALRLDKAIPKIAEKLPNPEKSNFLIVYSHLANHPNGLYAMIDYLNFKGEGTSPSEGYNGQGWGLLQVIQRISVDSDDVIRDFIQEAKAVLIQRVNNSPPERNEKRWLQGWLNRIDTYANF